MKDWINTLQNIVFSLLHMWIGYVAWTTTLFFEKIVVLLLVSITASCYFGYLKLEEINNKGIRIRYTKRQMPPSGGKTK